MRPRRSFGNFVTNWRESKLPRADKATRLVRNLALRVVRREGCCGHDGEPGC